MPRIFARCIEDRYYQILDYRDKTTGRRRQRSLGPLDPDQAGRLAQLGGVELKPEEIKSANEIVAAAIRDGGRRIDRTVGEKSNSITDEAVSVVVEGIGEVLIGLDMIKKVDPDWYQKLDEEFVPLYNLVAERVHQRMRCK